MKTHLYHYSAAPFIFDSERVYVQQAHDMKPRGLWVSAEDDGPDSFGWKDWCLAEDWNTGGFKHQTAIVISPEANILHIDSPTDLDIFTQRFFTRCDSLRCIDWGAVAKQYQGIVIAPYQWSCRLAPHTFWYYSWDCASGCVWDLSVVQAVQEARAASGVTS